MHSLPAAVAPALTDGQLPSAAATVRSYPISAIGAIAEGTHEPHSPSDAAQRHPGVCTPQQTPTPRSAPTTGAVR